MVLVKKKMSEFRRKKLFKNSNVPTASTGATRGSPIHDTLELASHTILNFLASHKLPSNDHNDSILLPTSSPWEKKLAQGLIVLRSGRQKLLGK